FLSRTWSVRLLIWSSYHWQMAELSQERASLRPVGVDFEGRETMVGTGVADPEVEADTGSSALVHVVGDRDDLLAVDVAPDLLALDRRPDQVPVLDSVRRADLAFERGPVADGAVPADDLGIAIVGLEAAEEDLVAGADVGLDAAAEPDLHLLEV